MRVAIAGYGVEGQSSLNYWRVRSDEVVVFDQRDAVDNVPEGIAKVLGPDAFNKLYGFDLVIRTPGLRPDAIKTNGKVWTATNEFFAQCPAPIIGVTGTKGKGTTSSLIASILTAAGRRVHLVGNIGTPALDELPEIASDDFVVYELSSFQLWDIKKSPQTAVVLMIEPDHLDVHTSMEEYVSAKSNIRRYQTVGDNCIYHPTNPYSRQVAGVPLEGIDTSAYGGSISFADRYGIKEENQVYVENGYFWVQDRQICSTDHLKLPGAYNLENACAAMSAVSELLYDSVTNEQYAKGLEAFTGLPHRLKFVAEKSGVRYFDDSIATTPGSALADIRSFNEPVVLILGGRDKGGDYSKLIEECARRQVRVVVYGENREKLRDLCEAGGVRYENVDGGMDEVVKTAAKMSETSDVVILSPAASSFDMFTNYGERGDAFVRAVERLS